MSSTAVLKKTTFLYRFLCTHLSRKTLRIMTLELGTVDTETMAPSRSSGSSFRRFFLSSRVQFKKVSMRTGKPVCAPPRLSEAFAKFSLKRVQS